MGVLAALGFGCSANPASSGSARESSGAIAAEAGFVELSPRDVSIHDRPVSLAAKSEIFYNFRPADHDAASAPVIVLFNGFASDVVRAFGTGPMSVEADGAVIANPDSLTQIANLLYIDPRQSGFSYDVPVGGAAVTDADCSQDVFNEYVDASDVLLTTLRFIDAHPALGGKVFWMGESFAGVRISWITAFLRGAWSLAPYEDETLNRALASADTARFLNGQILLQPWLAGLAHATAIQDQCASAVLLGAVESSIGQGCPTPDACACATYYSRSAYNYTLSVSEQNARIFAADAAQVSPADAEALYGVKLETISGLNGAARARGFKCNTADDTTPDQSALVSLLGALPAGQSYNLAYSPLTPGKGSDDPDWYDLDLIGAAFLDNAQSIDAFITDGQRDLVVPETALAPALRSISGMVTVSETTDALTLGFPNNPRNVTIRHYPNAGHMISMIEPHELSTDVRAWLSARN
ncbi:MAG TPA: hypothetical protein VHV51_12320 [Polyangiaceae bacterium]|nr:hypothetical protein [Polyangiaceae bacterium]